MVVSDRQRDRWRRNWDRGAARYDPSMRALDRLLFRDTRAWVCKQATGDVLEVAVGAQPAALPPGDPAGRHRPQRAHAGDRQHGPASWGGR
jgi:hypothetical protein